MRSEICATYRLQVHAGFTLNDGASLVGYLAGLGISHVYTSPIFQAMPGSTHGYDVVDPTQVNDEVGGQDALAHLSAALRNAGMGLVIDIVPNHMAIGRENPWWWDVLENGPASRYATYFDVEWNPVEARQENQILVPILGDHYGRVLENGEIRLDFNGEQFVVRYYENVYPVDPRSLHGLLAAAAEDLHSDTLAFLSDSYGRLPRPTATDRRSAQRRYREQAVLGALLRRLGLEEPSIRGAIDRAVNHLNADPDALDSFLAQQNYRLAYWRVTRGELGYRRFFDINTLIGLRMEDEQVYRDTHTLVHEWVAERRVAGLRIDHPDGLRDPKGYFERLHRAAPDTWIVIEKILEQDERLPVDWPVSGTTGYDFLNRLNGLFVDSDAEETLTDLYIRFTGEATAYTDMVRQKKFQVMEEVLGSDVARLTSLFEAVCERHRRHRDFTRNELREALIEVAANLPVYRTYVRPDELDVPAHDHLYIEAAIEGAKCHRPDLDPDLFNFFRDLLCLRIRDDTAADLVLRFQQFTGPVMAKGVEDTTFYNYNRFISLNEVGGNPARFSISVTDFHRHNSWIQANWPRTMLATSTHDTKRSEDVRARLNVLSEMPQQWAELVLGWGEKNSRHKQEGFPDRSAEYLLYQTLVGAWPIEVERFLAYMEKAGREAKVYTSWLNPVAAYEEAMAHFIRALYDDESFIAELETLVDTITEAGWINSLAQKLITLTAPGIPDIFQGTELWDFSLVDPDNRRPVDYARREALLAELDSLKPEAIWARAAEGLPKLWVVRQALTLRREHPQIFAADSSYRPVPIAGTENAVAYARGERAIVVTPRFTLSKGRSWPGATVALPAGRWHNLLSREIIDSDSVPLDSLLASFPVALLVASPAS